MPTLRLNKKWIHKIWSSRHGLISVCRIHPKDRDKLEILIADNSEPTVLLAWYLYVNEQQPTYQVMDNDPEPGEMAFTRFPLAAFLKTNEGYVASAEALIESKMVTKTCGQEVANLCDSVRPPAPAVVSSESEHPKHAPDKA
jgi:hypothetical protein